jgi:NADH dehydrogenase FAD-containing subunit
MVARMIHSANLVLVGGGHANLAVLADWAQRGPPAGCAATLITPHPWLTYSGMVPGWIAGECDRNAGKVDLAGLARRAGVRLVLDRCLAIDPDQRRFTLGNGDAIEFEYAAIDAGGVGRARAVMGDDPRLLELRPMDDFVARLDDWRIANRAGGRSVAVIGGGAGGLEIAFAIRNMAGLERPCAVQLVTGEAGLLPDSSPRLRRLAARELARQGVGLAVADARISGGQLYAGPASLEPVDLVIAALGSAAPDWPKEGGLACDKQGFIAVDRHQRSISHPHILAAGDIAARTDRHVPRSGVHAVHSGPVLAANLRSLLTGAAPQATYRPRGASLYLMNLGNGEALASYGPLAAQGRWAWRLKRWIDRRWIAAYAAISGV